MGNKEVKVNAVFANRKLDVSQMLFGHIPPLNWKIKCLALTRNTAPSPSFQGEGG